MPPKIKITKNEIVKTAIDIIRESGEEFLNARNIAYRLNCSTQPIFSNFTSMDELKDAVAISAYDIYLDFLNKEAENGQYPKYKAFGMAYIRFANEERELFKLIFMCDRTGKDTVQTVDFDTSVDMIMKANGISKEKAELMHLEMWACVHGIATMITTSFVKFEWELISKMISDVYQGLKQIHIGGSVV